MQDLVTHLLSRKEHIVRKQEVCYGECDPTYGPPVIAEFEVIDFEALMYEIDDFCRSFQK